MDSNFFNRVISLKTKISKLNILIYLSTSTILSSNIKFGICWVFYNRRCKMPILYVGIYWHNRRKYAYCRLYSIINGCKQVGHRIEG